MTTRARPSRGYTATGGIVGEPIEVNFRVGVSSSAAGDRTVDAVGIGDMATKPTTIDYVHRKLHTNGTGEFARVKLVFSPAPVGSGFTFKNSVPADRLRAQFVAATEQGLRTALDPHTDLTAELIDASYHDTDSSALTFEIAARGAVDKLNENND